MCSAPACALNFSENVELSFGRVGRAKVAPPSMLTDTTTELPSDHQAR